MFLSGPLVAAIRHMSYMGFYAEGPYVLDPPATVAGVGFDAESGPVGQALQDGQLRTLLTEYSPPEIALSAVYPRHRHLSAKVNLFVELLVERFGGLPYWDLVQ